MPCDAAPETYRRRGPVNTQIQPLSVFAKCRQFTKAAEIKAAGLYPYFKPISESEDTVVTIEGKQRIMLGSNNYLGLTHHPKVLEAAEKALHTYGSGCTGSRFLNGTLDLHEQLESRLATFLGKEACLVFTTGYQANLGAISALIGRDDVVYLDKLDHACIVDGAKMSYGETERFNHGDYGQLERKLQRHDAGKGALVAVDGVYSMEGTLADLPKLIPLCRKYGAGIMVDDAHSLGVFGPRGDGTGAHFGMTDQIDMITGTFSKSLASIGGYVAGDANLIDFLRHHSRPLIFTASLPPSNTAGVLAALDVLQTDTERRERLWANTKRLQDGMRGLGFDIGATQSPIVPVLIGSIEATFTAWRKLFDAGVFTNPVTAPAVPASQSRLRTSVMATHTFDQIDFAVDQFAKIGRELGLI